MPEIDSNKKEWNEKYTWTEAGDEWSHDFGNPDYQWHAMLLPRIRRWVPTKRILEIAPGFGRWTQFLKDQCQELEVVDLSDKCIEHCRTRFANASNIRYHINDGLSLAMIADNSIDFVFSFDSLVHVELNVMESYLQQIATKLVPGGAAFLHHSNIGMYRRYYGLVRRLPGKDWLDKQGLVQACGHWRAFSVSAKKIRQVADKVGLACPSQELINWRGKRLIDCLSVFVRPTTSERPTCRVWKNNQFMLEASQLRKIHDLYLTNGSGASQPTK